MAKRKKKSGSSLTANSRFENDNVPIEGAEPLRGDWSHYGKRRNTGTYTVGVNSVTGIPDGSDPQVLEGYEKEILKRKKFKQPLSVVKNSLKPGKYGNPGITDKTVRKASALAKSEMAKIRKEESSGLSGSVFGVRRKIETYTPNAKIDELTIERKKREAYKAERKKLQKLHKERAAEYGAHVKTGRAGECDGVWVSWVTSNNCFYSHVETKAALADDLKQLFTYVSKRPDEYFVLNAVDWYGHTFIPVAMEDRLLVEVMKLADVDELPLDIIENLAEFIKNNPDDGVHSMLRFDGM